MRRLLLGVVVGILAVAVPAGAAKLITGRDIANGTIKLKDLARSARPQAGPPGPPGPAGAKGSYGATVQVQGPQTPLGTSSGTTVGTSKAECPPGTGVISGSYQTGVRTFIATEQASGNGYFVIGVNTGPLTTFIKAIAICAGGAPAPIDQTTISTREAKRLARGLDRSLR